MNTPVMLESQMSSHAGLGESHVLEPATLLRMTGDTRGPWWKALCPKTLLWALGAV